MAADKEKLEELARRVETSDTFSQYDRDNCVVGIAQKMVAEVSGVKNFHTINDSRIAEFFGISVRDVVSLFYAHYEGLRIEGLKNLPFDEVTREIAADVVRQLADRG
jgi:hypothetical protein